MAKRVLTEAEEKIMDVLWQTPGRTMMEITHALEGETGWTKHTVTTLLKRMIQKETVVLDESGTVRRYAPAISRQDVAQEQTRSLLKRMFAGQASLLVENLVETGELTREDLQELMVLLEKRQA